MDHQLAFYSPDLTASSYLQRLREARSTVYDFTTRKTLNTDDLTAEQLLHFLQQHTVMRDTFSPLLHEWCTLGYEKLDGESRKLLASQSIRSPLEMRNWLLDLCQGDANFERRHYRKGDHTPDLFHEMFRVLLNQLPADVRTAADKVPCGGLFSNDISAYLLAAPRGEVAIVMPWNLFFFVWQGCDLLLQYCKSFARHTGGHNEEHDRRMEAECSDLLDRLCERLSYSCDAGPGLFRVPTMAAVVPEYANTLKTETSAGVVARSALYFVLLHEIGHIFYGHLRTDHYAPAISFAGSFRLHCGD